MKNMLAALMLASLAGAAWSQSYPTRPVRIVVAAETGGPDIVARLVAAQLQSQLGQPFVVENRPGANGIVGTDVVAKSPPDGYTLLVYSSGLVINPFVHKKLPYDTERDLVPVTNLTTSIGLFVAVHPSVAAQSLKEFLALARAPGARLAYSSPGVGNTWHLAMETFSSAAGIKMVHVPYKGGGPATAALSAGDVQVMLASPAPLMPHIKSGRVRVLAFSGDRRHPALPQVPTTAEAGLPKFMHDGGWFGMFAPGGTPPAVLDKLHREIRTAMQDPGVRAKLAALGVAPVADSPADFKRFIASELRSHAEQVRLAGIQPE